MNGTDSRAYLLDTTILPLEYLCIQTGSIYIGSGDRLGPEQLFKHSVVEEP